MSEISSEREAEIERVFADTLPLIQMALVHYRLGDDDRMTLEGDLRLWLHRLVVRTANERTPVSAFRSPLLLAACQFAHAHQSRRAKALARDPRLAEVLAQDPRAVALELRKMLDPESPQGESSSQGAG